MTSSFVLIAYDVMGISEKTSEELLDSFLIGVPDALMDIDNKTRGKLACN